MFGEALAGLVAFLALQAHSSRGIPTPRSRITLLQTLGMGLYFYNPK